MSQLLTYSMSMESSPKVAVGGQFKCMFLTDNHRIQTCLVFIPPYTACRSNIFLLSSTAKISFVIFLLCGKNCEKSKACMLSKSISVYRSPSSQFHSG